MKPKFLILVPARLGSVRVKKKNFKDFFEKKSLTDILMEKLDSLTSIFNKDDFYVILSTDNNDYIKNKKNYNFTFNILFHTRSNSASNTATSNEVLKDVKNFLIGKKIYSTTLPIFLFQVTSPLVTTGSINSFIYAALNNDTNYQMVSARLSHTQKIIEKTMIRKNKYFYSMNPDDNNLNNKKHYLRNSAMYFFPQFEFRYYDPMRLFIMKDFESIDIDTKEDFCYAQNQYRKFYGNLDYSDSFKSH
jgi:CMP-N-acetylneuraminic acid synthetase